MSFNENEFTQHFENLFNGENKGNTHTSEPYSTHVQLEVLDKPFTEHEIIKTITRLERNKSSGCHKIPPDFCVDSKQEIAPFLARISNNIYDTGIYPESWTSGIIVPIFKKGR